MLDALDIRGSKVKREWIFLRLSVDASYPLKELCISIAVFWMVTESKER